jgi:hypothetical protein
MTLKEALDDSVYNERFYNIVKSNLFDKKIKFTDGSIILKITSVNNVYLEHSGTDIYVYKGNPFKKGL